MSSEINKISVIVPVYNVENYLVQCVNSLIKQTYKNLEIILVDDGSTDSSGVLCEKLAYSDSRIKVYHKANGGVSDARNFGLKKATGNLIGFVDSDDYVDPLFFKSLEETMFRYDCDVVECHSVNFTDGNCPKVKYSDRVKCLDPKYWLTESNLGTFLPCVVWNKLYKKNLFEEIQFPVGRCYEDEAVMYKIIYRTNKVVRMESSLYFYRQREGSITHNNNKTKKAINDQFLSLYERCMYFDEKCENDISAFSYSKLMVYMVSVYGKRYRICGDKRDWYLFIKTNFHKVKQSKIVPIKYKLYIWIFLLIPFVFEKK